MNGKTAQAQRHKIDAQHREDDKGEAEDPEDCEVDDCDADEGAKDIAGKAQEIVNRSTQKMHKNNLACKTQVMMPGEGNTEAGLKRDLMANQRFKGEEELRMAGNIPSPGQWQPGEVLPRLDEKEASGKVARRPATTAQSKITSPVQLRSPQDQSMPQSTKAAVGTRMERRGQSQEVRRAGKESKPEMAKDQGNEMLQDLMNGDIEVNLSGVKEQYYRQSGDQLKSELHKVRFKNAELRQVVSKSKKDTDALVKEIEQIKVEIERSEKARESVSTWLTKRTQHI